MSVSTLYLFPFSSYMKKKPNMFWVCLQSETRFLNYNLNNILICPWKHWEKDHILICPWKLRNRSIQQDPSATSTRPISDYHVSFNTVSLFIPKLYAKNQTLFTKWEALCTLKPKCNDAVNRGRFKIIITLIGHAPDVQ